MEQQGRRAIGRVCPRGAESYTWQEGDTAERIARTYATTVQALQVLLVMAKLPVGAEGVVQVPGVVSPTRVELLRQPLADKTLAKIVCAGPVWL